MGTYSLDKDCLTTIQCPQLEELEMTTIQRPQLEELDGGLKSVCS